MLLGHVPRNVFWGHGVYSSLALLDVAKLLSKVTILICTPIISIPEFQLFHIFANNWCAIKPSISLQRHPSNVGDIYLDFKCTQLLDTVILLVRIYPIHTELFTTSPNLGIRALDSSAVSGQRLAKQANSNL